MVGQCVAYASLWVGVFVGMLERATLFAFDRYAKGGRKEEEKMLCTFRVCIPIVSMH